MEEFDVLLEPSCNTDIISYSLILANNQLLHDQMRRYSLQAKGYDIKFIMVLGRYVHENASEKTIAETQHKIVTDSRKLDDILQFDFVDHDDNLTLKHILALRWFTKKCSHVKVVSYSPKYELVQAFFIDRLARSWFSQYAANPDHFYCQRTATDVVILNENLTEKEYFAVNEYPPFCLPEGFSIISMPTVRELLRVADRVRYFRFDYVFVSSFLRHEAGIEIEEIGKYLVFVSYKSKPAY